MNFALKNPTEFHKRFHTTIERAKEEAVNFADLLKRLSTLSEDCVGMKVSFGQKPFIVLREGNTFILSEPIEH